MSKTLKEKGGNKIMIAVIETKKELDKLVNNEPLTQQDLMKLLSLTGEGQQELFDQARKVRKSAGLNEVRLRGVIEISSYCRNSCDYCAIRVLNKNLTRYRMNAEQILSIVAQIKEAGIPIAFLQSGEDLKCDPILEEVIPIIKKKYNMKVLLCVGERPKKVFDKFAQLGADSYIIKFETSNPTLYQNILHRDFSKRLDCIKWVREAGMLVGTGNIVGLPEQTLEDLANDILFAFELQPNFVSSSPFIPNDQTPLQYLPHGSLDLTLNTMAIFRIRLQNCLIPAVSALKKVQEFNNLPGNGQLMGLNAGANVLTINFTPPEFQEHYQIYSKERFVVKYDHALETIKQAGLEVYHSELP
jgi:biotin synthase